VAGSSTKNAASPGGRNASRLAKCRLQKFSNPLKLTSSGVNSARSTIYPESHCSEGIRTLLGAGPRGPAVMGRKDILETREFAASGSGPSGRTTLGHPTLDLNLWNQPAHFCLTRRRTLPNRGAIMQLVHDSTPGAQRKHLDDACDGLGTACESGRPHGVCQGRVAAIGHDFLTAVDCSCFSRLSLA